MKLISKEEYILNELKCVADRYLKNNQNIDPLLLKELIEQWSFDYEIEKEYRPELLEQPHHSKTNEQIETEKSNEKLIKTLRMLLDLNRQSLRIIDLESRLFKKCVRHCVDEEQYNLICDLYNQVVTYFRKDKDYNKAKNMIKEKTKM